MEVANQLCSLGSAVGAPEGRAPVPLAPPHCCAPSREVKRSLPLQPLSTANWEFKGETHSSGKHCIFLSGY